MFLPIYYFASAQEFVGPYGVIRFFGSYGVIVFVGPYGVFVFASSYCLATFLGPLCKIDLHCFGLNALFYIVFIGKFK